jgi:phage/plasmid-associated DNA primase
VLAATDAYRLSSDAVARFIDDCCYLSPHAHAKTGELYARWLAWARDDGTDPGSSNSDRHSTATDTPPTQAADATASGSGYSPTTTRNRATSDTHRTHCTHYQVPLPRAHIIPSYLGCV